MRRYRGKLFALTIAALGVAAIGAAMVDSRRALIERWYIAQLDSSDFETRKNAIEKLGAMQSERAVPALTRIAVEKEEAIRRQDIRARSIELRVTAMHALQTVGPRAHSAIPALVDFLVTHRPTNEGPLCGGVGRKAASIGAPMSQPPIWLVFPKLDPVQETLVKTLAAIGPAAVVPLGDALTNRHRRVEMTRSKRESFGYSVLMALVKLGESSIPFLLEGLEQVGDSDLHFAAREGLTKIGAPGVPRLLDLLGRSEGRPELQCDVVLALVKMGAGGKRVLESLARLVDSPELDVRLAAMNALAKVEPGTGVVPDHLSKLLLDAFEEEDDRVGQAAGKAIVNLGVPSSGLIHNLIDRFKASSLGDRELLFESIQRFGAAAVPLLLEILDDGDPALVAWTQSLLWQIGGMSVGARYQLEKALDTDKPKFRAQVRAILDLIGVAPKP